MLNDLLEVKKVLQQLTLSEPEGDLYLLEEVLWDIRTILSRLEHKIGINPMKHLLEVIIQLDYLMEIPIPSHLKEVFRMRLGDIEEMLGILKRKLEG